MQNKFTFYLLLLAHNFQKGTGFISSASYVWHIVGIQKMLLNE